MILADYHSCPCGLGYMGKEHLSSMHPSKWISMGIPVGIAPLPSFPLHCGLWNGADPYTDGVRIEKSRHPSKDSFDDSLAQRVEDSLVMGRVQTK